MRNYFFVFDKVEDRDLAFNEMYEVFKDCNDFKNKKIIICRTNEENKNKMYLSIEDSATGAYDICQINAFDKARKMAFTVHKSDCKDINVELPANCQIGTYYEEEKVKKVPEV